MFLNTRRFGCGNKSDTLRKHWVTNETGTAWTVLDKGVQCMRQVIPINSGWKFIRRDAGLPERLPEEWQTVKLPHTWNAVDGHDGNGSYDRGSYW